MRRVSLRFDIWLCLALAYVISLIPVRILEKQIPAAYEGYVEEHTVADGEIGGIAGESVFRAQSVADLESHETFTVISDGIEYRNRGAGYYENKYMYALTLPSGELVAACVNEDSVQPSGETIMSGDNTLPVGRLVYEDLSQNETFLGQIEFKEPLSRTDFYVDMLGDGGRLSQEDYTEIPTLTVQLLVVFISFPILHTIGSRVGIFPRFFPPRKKKEA